jgi:hypothetical protein
VVNVGTVIEAPVGSASLAGFGQAHRQPMLWWRGGAAGATRGRTL